MNEHMAVSTEYEHLCVTHSYLPVHFCFSSQGDNMTWAVNVSQLLSVTLNGGMTGM